ncbi:aspartate beta-hydroxylase domain-containing protein 2-like [Saccostrea echinata]|uniref:aspartate beta-hydroxylase domain-containing protein 2-like n=1 Tax=Saccostrea echinata TaxID=191078 RepID=UPI002A840BF9|nr:aspartate beta-hydroxylase domain-containing protein 2-like [Saccostrea echinata]
MFEHLFVVTVTTFLCSLFIFYLLRRILRETEVTNDSVSEFSSCINPNCVRCTLYRQVTVRACQRYKQLCKFQTETLESTRRVEQSLQVHGSNGQMLNGSATDPLVFHLKDLKLEAVYSPQSCHQFADDVRLLEYNKETIFSDFLFVSKPKYQHLWSKNNTPNGQWCVFHLINQGRVVQDNVAICEKTFGIITKLHNIMNRNVFGNVLFSVVNPGTTISTHCGPTNIRIRCHLGLKTVDECILTVSGMQNKWQVGKCLLFNDSFLHGVSHQGREEEGSRCVLIVDLWHPDISSQERNAIDFIFSPVKRLTQ